MSTRISTRWLPGGTALAAFAWVLVRAWHQSITIDEATTYTVFVARTPDLMWRGASNNHLLNTFLMWISTHLFGASDLTLRLPALLGAAVYIGSALALCRRIGRSPWVEWPLLVCLLFNPLVGDFLVAARGYSLANGFLLAALALGIGDWIRRPPARGAAVSACVGLAFTANFAYAFAAAAALCTIFWWNWRRKEARLVPLAAVYVLPGFALAAAIAGYTLLHWPGGELWFGVHSLGETFVSLATASLCRLDCAAIGLAACHALLKVEPWMFPLAGIVVAIRLISLMLQRADLRLALSLAAIPVLALGAHWVCFVSAGLLLPRERMGLYVIPFATLAVGALAAEARARWSRVATVVVLFAFGGYYLLCLRISYFEEWRWNADTRAAWRVLREYEAKHCVTRVGLYWTGLASLNYYREVDGAGSRLDWPWPTDKSIAEGRDIYVLSPAFNQEFIASHHLQVVMRGEVGEMLVAVTPEAQARTCPAQNWK